MCAVSVMMRHFGQRPRDEWTPSTYDDYLRLKRKFERYDVRTHQPHCEDPRKEAWAKEVEQMLRERYDFVPKKPKQASTVTSAMGRRRKTK